LKLVKVIKGGVWVEERVATADMVREEEEKGFWRKSGGLWYHVEFIICLLQCHNTGVVLIFIVGDNYIQTGKGYTIKVEIHLKWS